MSGLHITRYSGELLGQSEHLIIYLAHGGLDVHERSETIKKYLDEHPFPEKQILLLGAEDQSRRIERLRDSNHFGDLFERWECPVELRTFGRDGMLQGVTAYELQRLQRHLLTQIFRTRGGALQSTSATHFVKPSTRHTDLFLRAANVIQRGAELEIMAWGCLTRLKGRIDGIRALATDTGAINAVGLELRRLIGTLTNREASFSVDTFNSYEGLPRFSPHPDSVWLISATTSDGLMEKIQASSRTGQERILTLFSLGTSPPKGEVVCDLRLDTKDNPNGLPAITSYEAEQCEFCRRGSTPIQLTADQFLINERAVETFVPSRRDYPPEAQSKLNCMAGKGVLRAHFRSSSSRLASSLLFLNLTDEITRFEPDGAKSTLAVLQDAFYRRLRQSLPGEVALIVHLADSASEKLAQRIVSYLQQRGHREVQVVPSTEIPQTPLEQHGAVVVCAAVVASGASLVEVSRRLRNVENCNAISYLILVARTAGQKQLESLRSTIGTGPHGGFDVHVIQSLPLPADNDEDPWDAELQFLQSLTEEHLDSDIEQWIDTRIATIDGSARKNGLSNDLFWGAIDASGREHRLSYSSGFVFQPRELDHSTLTQADVFAIVVQVLHGARTPRDGRLAPSPLVHRVIGTGTFERFNDPLLHAALLRAAKAPELDYRCSDAESAQLVVMLRGMLSPQEISQGAIMEFAVAIGTSRLQMRSKDKCELIEYVQQSAHVPKLVRVVLLFALRGATGYTALNQNDVPHSPPPVSGTMEH